MAGLVVSAIYKINPKVGHATHLIALTLLGMVLTVTIVKQTPVGQVWALVLGIGAVARTALSWSYLRFSLMRTAFRYAALAPFAVASVFFFVAPTSRLVWTSDSMVEPLSSIVGRRAPVVVVVFDELPLASLIDVKGRVQSHFPNSPDSPRKVLHSEMLSGCIKEPKMPFQQSFRVCLRRWRENIQVLPIIPTQCSAFSTGLVG